ncbi:class I SAM-dependent methyltransferase [Nocardiopsis sp. NPDC050513]|uniref:class I SAM-dependent methyltransferase n=1 Tax=Nocardiopsis sp. NPDC050513 TaxID=3364338 RepID=UPI00379ED74D
MPGHHDEYARSAEFIDLLIAPWWTSFGSAVATVLSSADGADGPLVDVGAGSGRGTRLAVEARPGREVIAVEPAAGLRSVLLARAADPDWGRGRVTVLDGDLLSVSLPDRIGGLLAMNVIGHFSPDDRARVWTLLTDRLTDGAVAVLNLQPPFEPAAIERTVMGEVEVGRRRYRGWASAVPSGEDRVRWTMTYETHEAGDLVSSADVHYDWWLLTPDALRAEAADHGLDVRPEGPEEAGIHVLRRAGD